MRDEYLEYLAHGWKLCDIAPGSKGPRTRGWNAPNAPFTGAGNAGLCHAYSGTCAVDIDSYEQAAIWLAERGVALDALLTAPDAVRIASGRPGRHKLLYALPTALASVKIAKLPDGKRFAFELRCATAEGLTVQDVLPSSIHPETGMPYRWEYGDDLLGDWRALPPLPAALQAIWEAELAPATSLPPEASSAPSAREITPQLVLEARAFLERQDPDCPYDEWLRLGAALHYEFRGHSEGLRIWDQWSRGGRKYGEAKDGKPAQLPADKWVTFRLNAAQPATFGAWRQASIADPTDFPILLESANVSTPIKYVDPCTDEANAARLQRRHGTDVVAIGGQFFSWTGKYWRRDETQAATFMRATDLSKIVDAECRALEATRHKLAQANPGMAAVFASVARPAQSANVRAVLATKAGADYFRLTEQLKARRAWSTRCGSVSTIQSAVQYLKNAFDKAPDAMDRGSSLLNCANGTVDLRNGALKPHDRTDFLTQCTETAYKPEATAPRFREFLLEIMKGDAEKVGFLHRWFGYCATKETREQKFLIHVGDGGNGKGTLLNALRDVLGAYMTPAAPGLIDAKQPLRSEEIADLFGRRLVTVNEPDHGMALRESLVKHITGEDQLKGRFLYQQLFEFTPTHKLQLLCNSMPSIEGQDGGIWRRVCVVRYDVKFGDAAQVASGTYHKLRDTSLTEVLRSEREGILAWLVEGAKEWYLSGLREPQSVTLATWDYRRSQARTEQFANQCAELDAGMWTPLRGIYGLYPAYERWCKASGYFPKGVNRFVEELKSCVPYFRKMERVHGGQRVIGYYGLRLPSAFQEDAQPTTAPDLSDLGF